MAATRLDHPVLMSTDQIRRREFVTARRGYDADQVRAFLEEIASQMDVMASMIRESRMEADAAVRAGSQPQADPYERLAARVSSVIREADETAERLRIEGSREAERMMLEARTQADQIRTDAQAKAEQARAEAQHALLKAREQADRTISGLSARREAVVDQLAQMQERLLGVARDLEAAIVTPIDEPIEGTGDAETDAIGDAETEAVVEAETEGVAEADETPEASDEIVDVRSEEEPVPANAAVPLIVADQILEGGLDDPSYEELWEGTETIPLEVPDIPPLDLSWGDEDDDGLSAST
jgi:DivIVA domain-containing protein